MKTLYWSADVGKFVDKYDGSSINDPLFNGSKRNGEIGIFKGTIEQWNETLLFTIIAAIECIQQEQKTSIDDKVIIKNKEFKIRTSPKIYEILTNTFAYKLTTSGYGLTNNTIYCGSVTLKLDDISIDSYNNEEYFDNVVYIEDFARVVVLDLLL